MTCVYPVSPRQRLPQYQGRGQPLLVQVFRLQQAIVLCQQSSKHGLLVQNLVPWLCALESAPLEASLGGDSTTDNPACTRGAYVLVRHLGGDIEASAGSSINWRRESCSGECWMLRDVVDNTRCSSPKKEVVCLCPLNEREKAEASARDRTDNGIPLTTENTAETKENNVCTEEGVGETAGRVRLEHSAWMGEETSVGRARLGRPFENTAPINPPLLALPCTSYFWSTVRMSILSQS